MTVVTAEQLAAVDPDAARYVRALAVLTPARRLAARAGIAVAPDATYSAVIAAARTAA